MKLIIFITLISLKGFAFESESRFKGIPNSERGSMMEVTVNRDPSSLNISEIMPVGKMIWDLIQENQVPINISENMVHALPAGASGPFQLSGWKHQKTPTYQVEFKNFIGEVVARFNFYLIFDYAGNVDGTGSYLANVSVVPTDTKVKSLFKLDVQIQVMQPVNTGTDENPVASLTLNIRGKSRDVLLGGEKVISSTVTVDGTGNYTSN